MLVAAGVILQVHVVALRIDEARLPISRVEVWIVNRDDIFELIAGLANAFGGDELVAVRQTGGIEECLVVKAVALNDESVAFVMADRMSAIGRIEDRILIGGQLSVQPNRADLMVEFMHEGHLADR